MWEGAKGREDRTPAGHPNEEKGRWHCAHWGQEGGGHERRVFGEVASAEHCRPCTGGESTQASLGTGGGYCVGAFETFMIETRGERIRCSVAHAPYSIPRQAGDAMRCKTEHGLFEIQVPAGYVLVVVLLCPGGAGPGRAGSVVLSGYAAKHSGCCHVASLLL